ncbi:MAG: ferritin-like domain-containing protein [Oscillospiraceae bacterium]|nr:ferritin-like domain-containing protein [Oscillospiraceae bacterium]
MNHKATHDTSHYAHCSTLMLKYKRNHMLRLILSAVILYANFFCMTVVWCRKDPTEAIQSAVYTSEGQAAVNPFKSIIGILLMLICIIVGVVVYKTVKNPKIRKIALIGMAVAWVIFSIVNLYSNVKRNESVEAISGGGNRVDHLAYGYGILALLFSGGTLALAFFGTQEHTKLYIALLIEIILAMLAGCYHWIVGAVLLGLFLLAIPEYKKMPWIMKQPGYPYFNERFEEQARNSEYEADHKLDGKRSGSMLDLDGTPVPASEPVETIQPEPQVTAAYTMHTNAPDEMPGIDDILEAAAEPEPLPEPELPKAEDIALPTWDVPDPKLDTAGILSSIPEPGAVPDLPTVPDVPKL